MAPEDVRADCVESSELHQRLEHRAACSEVAKSFLNKNPVLLIRVESPERCETC